MGLGGRGMSILATPPPGWLSGVVGVVKRGAPGNFPDRADLLTEDTLPKGS